MPHRVFPSDSVSSVMGVFCQKISDGVEDVISFYIVIMDGGIDKTN